jgi:lipopolysaccharide transport system ATP-binding protein
MSRTVIQAEGLGKRYRIGLAKQHNALSHVIGDVLRAPIRLLHSNHNSDAHANGGSAGPSTSSSTDISPKCSGSPYIWALKDVSFDVKEGEVVGLIGRNGAGKSTLLKILARITRPTEGHAEIHGRIGSLLEVGTGFHPELTGRENVFMSGAVLGMRAAEIRRKFDEIVAFSEVERFLDTPLKHYSSGMQMRLAFAVAAHLEPEILLVDEVLAVGDASFQKKCLGKMGDISKQGRTIVFVSHNMVALRKLCPRAIRLEGGQIVESGDSNAVVGHYLQGNMDARLETEWEDPETAPGDRRARLRSVRVIPKYASDGLITVHTPLCIEFTYWNYVADAALHVSMILNDAEDTCVFNTGSSQRPLPAGLIRQTLEIPGDFLNTGSYHIDVMIVKDSSVGILLQSNTVAFEVVEGEVVGNWYGRVPGAVRPKFHWKTDTVESGDVMASNAKDRR